VRSRVPQAAAVAPHRARTLVRARIGFQSDNQHRPLQIRNRLHTSFCVTGRVEPMGVDAETSEFPNWDRIFPRLFLVPNFQSLALWIIWVA
jgi:hypothetical protein